MNSDLKNNTNTFWQLRCFVFEELLSELENHFTTINAEYMPIKGAYLIATGLSGSMRFRQMADLDILVKECDMERCSQYFFSLPQSTPRTYYKENYRPYETQFSYKIGNYHAAVEIHSQLNFPERFVLPTEELFSRAVSGGGLRKLPCPEDSLLIFLTHAFTHFFLEFRETNFEEIGLLLAQKGFCWEKFWASCQKTGIVGFIYMVLRLFEENTKVLVQFPKRYWYEEIQVRIIRRFGYQALPRWYKRLFCELPYIKKPLSMVLRKFESRST